MAYTIAFAGIQVLAAIAFIIVTSKFLGPSLFWYDTHIQQRTIEQFAIGNLSYILIPNMDKRDFVASIGTPHQNTIFYMRLEPVSFSLVPVLLLTAFTVLTLFKTPESNQRQKKINNDDTYTQETMQEHANWHHSFVLMVFLTNVVCISYLCSPSEIVNAVILSIIITLELDIVIAPRDEEGHNFGKMFNAIAMMLSWAYIFTQLRTDFDGPVVPFLMKVIIDMLVILTHTGTEVVMEQIVESRVLYSLLHTFMIATLYIAWGHKR